ncbi:MAG: hypothetical protein AAF267_23470, partial [Deinococcota bacterium]
MMTWLEPLVWRLKQSDLLQLLFAYFVLLTFVLMVTWPQPGQPINNSWFALEQTNVSALVILALIYGSWLSSTPRPKVRNTLIALLCFQLLSLPLKMASFAASFPGVPLWWSLITISLTVIAFFGFGLALGRAFDAINLGLLKPLTAPLVIGGAFALDVGMGVP